VQTTTAARAGEFICVSRFPLLAQDISFEVFRGDRVAIVGPSGAGKTSLLAVKPAQ